MSWEAGATLVALVGVFVTFVFNIRSNKLTRRWADQDRNLAREALQQERELHEAAASRAEAAARLTEEYTRRVVEALESIAENGPVAGSVRPSRVQWSLDHHAGDRYRLTNVGDLAAHTIRLKTDETLPVDSVQGGPTLLPGEALSFMAAPTLATRDSTVTVTWTDDVADELQSWRYPLPARPRS